MTFRELLNDCTLADGTKLANADGTLWAVQGWRVGTVVGIGFTLDGQSAGVLLEAAGMPPMEPKSVYASRRVAYQVAANAARAMADRLEQAGGGA